MKYSYNLEITTDNIYNTHYGCCRNKVCEPRPPRKESHFESYESDVYQKFPLNMEMTNGILFDHYNDRYTMVRDSEDGNKKSNRICLNDSDIYGKHTINMTLAFVKVTGDSERTRIEMEERAREWERERLALIEHRKVTPYVKVYYDVVTNDHDGYCSDTDCAEEYSTEQGNHDVPQFASRTELTMKESSDLLLTFVRSEAVYGDSYYCGQGDSEYDRHTKNYIPKHLKFYPVV